MANVFQNLRQTASNIGTNLIQSPDMLKNQSLILASLVLVISRITIAKHSAVKERGTPEGPYRYREFIRTTIREICGWTFGFVVLRALQNFLVKPRLRKLLGLEEVHPPNAYSTWENIKSFFKGHDIAPIKLQLHEETTLKHTWNPFSRNLADTKTLRPFIEMYGIGEPAKIGFIKGVYKVGSILLASIPTVALAGYALERFTRDHSDQVVDKVSHVLGHNAPKAPNNKDKGPRSKHPDALAIWQNPSYSVPTAAAAAFKGFGPQQPQRQGWLSPAPIFTYPKPYSAAAAAFSGHAVSAPKRYPAIKPQLAIQPMVTNTATSNRFAV